jgi:predicted O-linked N-acetylglucosamine transferase (SPINDLY family)
MDWHPDIYQHILSEQYHLVAEWYEQALDTEPDTISHGWYLGLAYLLDNQEEAAQATWLFTVAEGTQPQVESWTVELISILKNESNRQQQCGNAKTAWLIRQHIRELRPDDIDNLIKLLDLSIALESFEPSDLSDWQIVDLLSQQTLEIINPDELLRVLFETLKYPAHEVLEFTKASLFFANDRHKWIQTLLTASLRIGEDQENPAYAADLVMLCLELDENNLEVLKRLSGFLSSALRFNESIKFSQRYRELANTVSDHFFSNYQLLRALALSGSWLDLEPVAQRHKALLQNLFDNPEYVTAELRNSLIPAVGYLAYIQDNLLENRYFQNQVGRLFQPKAQKYSFQALKTVDTSRRIKVGYIAHTLRQHSVGWLSRWLFQHHDREQFETSIYFVNQNLQDEFYEQWFKPAVDSAKSCGIEATKIADQIYEDRIDILVDLDSITLNVTYEVMSLKPAPVQVSWLGWDASGLPAIDYFIADPYVLAEDAQEHYQEKIWRLPSTYVAVDGFEVGIPTLRREDLSIPADAVVFQSAQAGAKRHPNTVRLQLKILKEVPNSYFLIKARGDAESVKEVFIHLAQQEGVNPDRLRFSGFDSSEYTHRANLKIADVVLDTYPYNGATTTLETLWLGIPLITRVGSTFSARNSYSFMINAGITEGIAWTDEEYVEWGVRLGRDEALRQQVSWKLSQSRQSSALWNAKQFTREMENAYQQMWAKYLERSN